MHHQDTRPLIDEIENEDVQQGNEEEEETESVEDKHLNANYDEDSDKFHYFDNEKDVDYETT